MRFKSSRFNNSLAAIATLEKIQQSQGNRSYMYGYGNGPWDQNTIPVMYFEYKTYSDQVFKIKETEQGLVKATLDGNFASVDVQNNGNIETLIFKSTTDVNNGDIDIDTNSDLESITFAGAKTSGVIINANNSLESVTVDATMQTTLATGATLDGSIAVTSNTDLEALTLKGTNVSVLTVTGNVDLETIDGTGLTTLGATAASNNVNITGNKLSASVANDKTNAAACTSCANLEANDLGGFTTTPSISESSALKSGLL